MFGIQKNHRNSVVSNLYRVWGTGYGAHVPVGDCQKDRNTQILIGQSKKG